jgi:hypothetical protein
MWCTGSGASKAMSLSHLAVTNISKDGNLKWMERVTNEE